MPELCCQFLRDRSAARQAPKPRDLPLGEVTTARFDAFDSLRKCQTALQMLQEFFVAEGLSGLGAQWSAQVTQPFHLVKEPLGEHGIDTAIDALVQKLARQVE